MNESFRNLWSHQQGQDIFSSDAGGHLGVCGRYESSGRLQRQQCILLRDKLSSIGRLVPAQSRNRCAGWTEEIEANTGVPHC